MRKIVFVLLMLLLMILALLQNSRSNPGKGNHHEPAAMFLAGKDGPK
ncbi:hypothetical protein ACFLRB_01540 [Acidobacteriota bacterium]